MDPYVGEIRMFAGTYAPLGWQMCDGSLLPVPNYEALYTLLGTQFGGDGIRTFGVPDFRGRIPIHQGTGPGLSPYIIGRTGGVENVPLSLAQLPSHNHLVNVTTAAATTVTPGTTVNLAATTAPAENFLLTLPNPAQPKVLDGNTVEASGTPVAPPHPNIMPSVVVTFIIAWNGIYPTRN